MGSLPLLLGLLPRTVDFIEGYGSASHLYFSYIIIHVLHVTYILGIILSLKVNELRSGITILVHSDASRTKAHPTSSIE